MVVVGVDGSDGSAKALAWAVQEARMRGAILRVVHAWHFPRLSDGAYVQASTPAEPSGFPSDDTAYDEFRSEVIGKSGGPTMRSRRSSYHRSPLYSGPPQTSRSSVTSNRDDPPGSSLKRPRTPT